MNPGHLQFGKQVVGGQWTGLEDLFFWHFIDNVLFWKCISILTHRFLLSVWGWMRVKQRHGFFCLKAFPNWFIQYFYFVSTVPQTIIFQLILDWFIFSSFFSVLIWLLKHIFIFCTTVPTVTWFEYKENDPLSYKAADICQNPKHWAFDKYLTMVWLTESVLKEGNNFVWKVVLHRDCAAGTLVAHSRGSCTRTPPRQAKSFMFFVK